MTSDISLFESVTVFKAKKYQIHYVTLDDDTTTLAIKGYGYMSYITNKKQIKNLATACQIWKIISYL